MSRQPRPVEEMVERTSKPGAAGHGRPNTTLLSQGTVVGDRYEIRRVAGRGGMSNVYVARDTRFRHIERLCAVKEMQVSVPDPKTRELRLANFEREAEMLATLNHPSIPKIYDFFSDGGLIYLVLEFIEGEDLEAYIDRQDAPVDESTLTDWALVILDVLSYLHEHQPEPIVFRDLKPSNIMLRSDGEIVLIDFGIARTFQPLQRGTMIGTEGYAPPEQYRGIAEPRGDIYALGATLHHLSTKSDPRIETPFTFDQRPPRGINPNLSKGLETVLMRALAYAPADRFPSAAAMAQALSALRATDPSQPAAPWRETRESNFLSPRVSQIVEPANTAPEARSIEPLLLPPQERVMWTVQTGDEVRASATIQNGRAYIGSYDGHLYAIDIGDGDILWRFRAHRGITGRPHISGEILVTGSEDQHVYGLKTATGRMVWSFRTAMPVRSSATSFGDSILIGADDGYCYSIGAAQGNLLWRQRTWGAVRSSPLVHQDGVLLGSDDGALYHLSAADGKTKWRSPLGRPIMSSPAATGQIVAVGSNDGRILGLDISTGEVRWAIETQGPVLASPRESGNALVVGSSDGAVYAIDAPSGDILWKAQIATQITSTLGLHGGYGYVGTIDGYVQCLNLRDGSVVWSHKLGAPVVSSPGISDGVVVVGSLDGRVYGLRL